MWPFKSRPRIPLAPLIHPDDADLVGPRDYEWWSKQSLQGINSLLRQDEVFIVAKINDCMSRQGMSDKDAVKETMRWFPVYYFLSLDDRDNAPLAETDDDRPLPVVIKDRINRARMNGSIGQRLKRELPGTSSANAWCRAAIRRNEI